MISHRIKTILNKKGMTQVDLALKLGIGPNTLSRTINGNPTLKSITDIANALDVDVVDLFTSNNPKGFVEYKGTLHRITKKEDLETLLNNVNNE